MRRRSGRFPYVPVALALLFVVTGIVLLRATQAASLTVSAEAEQASISGKAERKDDGAASGGQSVKFGVGGSGGGLFQATCDGRIALTSSGTLGNGSFKEISGIAASRTTDNTYWVHNDSGDSNRIFSVSNSGALLGTFTISGATATDWEDIATGPGPASGQSYVYIADVGNNDLDRGTVQVYRLPEPNPNNGGGTKSVNADKLNLTYAGGTRHNVEAVFVDPGSGELYIIDKTDKRKAMVFRAPANLAANSTTVMTKVGEVGFTGDDGYELVTAADMSPTGDAIAVRTYERLYIFGKPAGASVAAALAGTPCAMPAFDEEKGEAVGFKRSGTGLVTVSEGSGQPLRNFDIRP